MMPGKLAEMLEPPKPSERVRRHSALDVHERLAAVLGPRYREYRAAWAAAGPAAIPRFPVHLDLELRVRLPRGWGLRAAYAFQSWFGIRSKQRFVDALSQNTTVEIAEDVVFEGLLVGASYEF